MGIVLLQAMSPAKQPFCLEKPEALTLHRMERLSQGVTPGLTFATCLVNNHILTVNLTPNCSLFP